jgi:hypothetical protein
MPGFSELARHAGQHGTTCNLFGMSASVGGKWSKCTAHTPAQDEPQAQLGPAFLLRA